MALDGMCDVRYVQRFRLLKCTTKYICEALFQKGAARIWYVCACEHSRACPLSDISVCACERVYACEDSVIPLCERMVVMRPLMLARVRVCVCG